MRTPEENIQLANMLFPEVKETPADVETKYREILRRVRWY